MESTRRRKREGKKQKLCIALLDWMDQKPLKKKRITEGKVGTSRRPMNQNGEEKAEEKGKGFLSFFMASHKKKESNSAHYGTQNITGPGIAPRIHEGFQ